MTKLFWLSVQAGKDAGKNLFFAKAMMGSDTVLERVGSDIWAEAEEHVSRSGEVCY